MHLVNVPIEWWILASHPKKIRGMFGHQKIPLCISASWQIEVGELWAATLPEQTSAPAVSQHASCRVSLRSIWMCLVTLHQGETKDAKPLQSHLVHAPGQCLDWAMNIRCSHSETLIHSVYNHWKRQVTTHELSFQDNLPIKHHDLKMWCYVPKCVPCKSVGCQDFSH